MMQPQPLPLLSRLLSVSDLRITLPTPHGPAQAVRGVSFDVAKGDTLGLIGESGCGKSLTALAIMGLLPASAVVQGSIRFNGQELIGADEATLRRLRGNRMAMVFQEPMTALNPVHTVGHQIAEPLILHQRLSRAAAQAESLRLLERVGIADAARRLHAYPHQFSGGQRQRISIAMALACGPDVLIADEPTTALDVTVAGEVLALMAELVRERGMGLVLISHDLGVIAQNVAHMLVMYAGSVVESGPTRTVFTQRAHPYTRGLFAARPSFGLAAVPPSEAVQKRLRLPSILGTVPELHHMPSGCAFAARCDVALPSCTAEAPPVVMLADEHAFQHAARCIKAQP